MKDRLRAFLREPRPDPATAVTFLRLVYAGMFGAQTVVAALLGLLLLLLAPPARPAAPVLSWTLVALAALQLPLALLMVAASARAGGKGAALSATLVAGVLLSTPAWFLMMALVMGSRGTPPLLLLLQLAVGYALGFGLTGRLARLVPRPPPEGDEDADGESGAGARA